MSYDYSNLPVFRQIAERVADRIIVGQWPAESRLPSVREYAAEVEVNVNTVMRTYEWLARQGVIYNKRGIGYFVDKNAVSNILAARRSEFFDREMSGFFDRLALMGITPEQLHTLYSQHLDNHKNVPEI